MKESHTHLTRAKHALNEALKTLQNGGEMPNIDKDVDLLFKKLLKIKAMSEKGKVKKGSREIAEMLRHVADSFSLSVQQMKSGCREYDKALARQVFAIVAKSKGYVDKEISICLNREGTTTINRMGKMSVLKNRLDLKTGTDAYRITVNKVFQHYGINGIA